MKIKLFWLILIQIATSYVYAQINVNSAVQDFLISDENSPSTFIQNNVRIFPFRADNFIAVWNDEREGIISNYAQEFNKYGNLLGNNFKLSSNQRVRTTSNGFFINVSEKYQENFDVGEYVYNGYFYNIENRLTTSVYFGRVQMPWCGTGYLGYNYECVNTSNQYLFHLRDDGRMNISKYNVNGEKTFQIHDSLLENRRAIYSTVGSNVKNDYAFVWLHSSSMSENPIGIFGTFLNNKDSVVAADVPLGFPIDSNNQHWFYAYQNSIKIIGLPDSNYLIFFIDVDSSKCYYRKYDSFGIPKSNINTLNVKKNISEYYTDIINFVFSPFYENKFKVLITTRGSYPIFYNHIYTFNTDGNLYGAPYIDSTFRTNIGDTFIPTTDSSFIIGVDDGKDVFLASTKHLTVEQLTKLNDDQVGSNEANPVVLPAEENHFFVIWENETQIKGQKVNINGEKVGAPCILNNKNIESFTDGTYLVLWRQSGIGGQDTIGYTIYSSNWIPIIRNKIVLCHSSQELTNYKPLTDSSFVVVIKENSTTARLILVDKNKGAIKDIQVTTSVDIVSPQISIDVGKFYLHYGDKIILLSNQLEILSEEITMKSRIYLGGNRFLSYRESLEWPYLAPIIYGTIVTINGDIVKKDFILVNYPNEYRISSLNNGRFILLARKWNNIFARTFTKDGIKDKDSIIIHSSSNNSKRHPSFALKGEKVIFVWSEARTESPGFSVYGSVFNLSNLVDVNISNYNEIPKEHFLFQNYPNPFNPTTVISYRLSANSFVNLKVYDILGREVAILVNEIKQAGNYEVKFDGSKLTSGVYFYKMNARNITGIESGTFTSVKKIVLLK